LARRQSGPPIRLLEEGAHEPLVYSEGELFICMVPEFHCSWGRSAYLTRAGLKSQSTPTNKWIRSWLLSVETVYSSNCPQNAVRAGATRLILKLGRNEDVR